MGRGRFLALLLFVFIFADASNASKYRTLIGEPSIGNSTVSGKKSPVLSPPPPSPTPVTASGGNGSDPKPVDGPNKKETTSPASAKTPISDPVPTDLANNTKKGERKDPKTETEDPVPVPGKGPKEDPKLVPQKGSKKDPEPAPDTTPNEEKKGEPVLVPSSPGGGKEKSEDADKEKKNSNATLSPNADKESCNGAIKTCKVKAVIACIKNFDSGSREVTILIQNTGDSTLKAKLSADNTNKDLVLFKNKNEKVNVSLGSIDKSNKITLNAGNGECELTMDPPISEDNFFLRFPSREKLVTPINGAYLLIATVLIFGGSWACCMVRKRKQRAGGGVPYQELEMGLPESASATAVETAEGWDQGWDDDWDGDNAVKSPGGHIAGSISSNGLTSRSTNKDGWENDWDD